ncbi:MAG: hypothetical protein ACHQQQ_05695 [Bacteroidota bacterium]
MSDLNKEIEAYETMRRSLESTHIGKWILIHDQKLVDIYDSFEKAAEDAVKRFGQGPYLIRQIGAPPIVLPASVVYNLSRA